MGLIEEQIQKSVPNASNCLTSSAVQASHMKRGEKVIYKIEDIYGMIIPLGMGLGGGMTILILEFLIVKGLNAKKQMKNPPKRPSAKLPTPTLPPPKTTIKITITTHQMELQSIQPKVDSPFSYNEVF